MTATRVPEIRSRAQPALLEVRDLHVEFGPEARPARVLTGVDLSVSPGQSIGLVGETGCGKSLTARAMMGLLPRGARVTQGGVWWEGTPLHERRGDARLVRGRRMALVFQGARSALNPIQPIGRQLSKVVRSNRGLSRPAAREAAIDMLARVEINDPRRRYGQYPHELSGGMCQRVMIAMALLCAPELVILDEPTTGLDVTVQAGILELIDDLIARGSMAMVLISHDLGVVSRVCGQIGVMYAGRLVEFGSTEAVLTDPAHPYTRQLDAVRLPGLSSARTLAGAGDWATVPDPTSLPEGCHFQPRCPWVDELCASEPPVVGTAPGGWSRCHHVDKVLAVARPGGPPAATSAVAADTPPTGGPGATLVRVHALTKDFHVRGSDVPLRAVDAVDLTIARGASLGVVGESGSGKSTLGRCVLGLLRPTAGTVEFDGHELTGIGSEPLRRLRRRMQMVFQDPWESLNPRRTVQATVGEPLRLHLGLQGAALRHAVDELLERVNLDRALAGRYPSALSGGQRQRVGIARAIATGPDFLVLDEPTSSLDVSVQAQILALLGALQADLGLAYMLISHDLNVIRHMTDEVAVMYLGAVVESGSTERVLRAPLHPYTQALISAIPRPPWESGPERIRLEGEVGSPLRGDVRGCRMADHCPLVMPVCREQEPGLDVVEGTHRVACHAVAGSGTDVREPGP